MRRTSFEDARLRRNLAAARLEDLGRVDPESRSEDVVVAWEAFNAELNRAFNKIFHGEKGGSPASVIVQRIREDRRSDPLLSYLRIARDIVEHSVGRAAGVKATACPPPADEGVAMIQFVFKDEDGKQLILSGETGKTWSVKDFRQSLLTLEGRITPPTEHLGQPLTDISPTAIGAVALQYLDDRLQEIEAASAASWQVAARASSSPRPGD